MEWIKGDIINIFLQAITFIAFEILKYIDKLYISLTGTRLPFTSYIINWDPRSPFK